MERIVKTIHKKKKEEQLMDDLSRPAGPSLASGQGGGRAVRDQPDALPLRDGLKNTTLTVKGQCIAGFSNTTGPLV